VDPEQVRTYPQQLNLYVYVRNDPVNFVDRDGRNLGLVNEDGTQEDGLDNTWGYLGTKTYWGPNDEVISEAVFRGSRGGSRGGGEPGTPTVSPWIETVLSGNCIQALTDLLGKLPIAKTLADYRSAAGQMRFMDLHVEKIQQIPLSRFIRGAKGGLLDLWENIADMDARMMILTETKNRHVNYLSVVLIAPGYLPLADPNDIIALKGHETLHFATQQNDGWLATNLNLDVSSGVSASQAITRYLKSGCDSQYLKKEPQPQP